MKIGTRSPAPIGRSRKQVLMGEEAAAALIKDGDVVIVGRNSEP